MQSHVQQMMCVKGVCREKKNSFEYFLCGSQVFLDSESLK